MQRAAAAWNVRPVKLPLQYRVDWAIIKNGHLAGWVECKKRNVPRRQYATLLLSLNKVLHGLQLSQTTGLPFILLVEWSDCIGWQKITAVEGLSIGGRIDRDDWQDVEPVCHFPTEGFNLLRNG